MQRKEFCYKHLDKELFPYVDVIWNALLEGRLAKYGIAARKKEDNGKDFYRKLKNREPSNLVKITVLEPKKKCKFFFEQTPRQESPESFHMRSPLKDSKRSLVGEPINFRGVIYGPINEQGVVFLFSKVHGDLGIKIEAIQQGFTDAKARRFNGRAWVSERAEFEFRSSHFIQHGHDLDKCDIIVCWINDWPDCPLEVIELKAIIEQLPS